MARWVGGWVGGWVTVWRWVGGDWFVSGVWGGDGMLLKGMVGGCQPIGRVSTKQTSEIIQIHPALVADLVPVMTLTLIGYFGTLQYGTYLSGQSTYQLTGE